MIEPIKPEDIVNEKTKVIPDEVLETFNEFIAEKWNGSSSTFKQKDLVKVIKEKLEIKDEDDKIIFDKHWLDVEDIFREAGWKVYYDKPAYNETYDATFEFKIFKDRRKG